MYLDRSNYTLSDTQAYFDVLREDLALLNKREVLEFFVDYGKYMDDFPQSFRTAQYMVPGCISPAFIVLNTHSFSSRSGEKTHTPRVYFSGTSESMIVRGYVHLLICAFNGLLIDDFQKHTSRILEDFLHDTNLHMSLVSSRANSFGNIFSFMQQSVQLSVTKEQ